MQLHLLRLVFIIIHLGYSITQAHRFYHYLFVHWLLINIFIFFTNLFNLKSSLQAKMAFGCFNHST